MEAKDRYLAIAVLTFGLVYTMAAWNLPRASVGNPFGPVYFPLGLGLLVTFVGLVMLIQSFRSGQEEHKPALKRGDYAVRVLIAVSLCVGYALMFNRLGFVISTFAFLSVFLMFLNGLKKWLLSASVAFLYTIGVWYLFEKIFLINLP
ncbi:tripartite tricarboxylate transporter TctB family protein [Pseudothermotoga sp.]